MVTGINATAVAIVILQKTNVHAGSAMSVANITMSVPVASVVRAAMKSVAAVQSVTALHVNAWNVRQHSQRKKM